MPVLPVPVPVPSGEQGGIEAAAPAEEIAEETDADDDVVPVIVGADGVEHETVETIEDPEVVEVIEMTEPVEEVELIVGPLPRMPFFGCEEVTEDEFRAILDEIARTPED